MKARAPSLVLDPASAARLAKLCGMLGSAHDGERAVAAAMADALIKSKGLTWAEVIASPPALPAWRPGWRVLARQCLGRSVWLTPSERDFLENILQRNRALTRRQVQWLDHIHASVVEMAP